MHGDRVLASVTGVDRRGRREGAIVEVLERRLNRLIGRFTVEAGIGYVVPDDRRIQRNVLIPPDAARRRASTASWSSPKSSRRPIAQRPPIGTRAGGARRQADGVARGRGRDPRPRDPARIPAGSARRGRRGAAGRRRRDGRAAASTCAQLPLVTIDGEDAKDFDDAVYCEPNARRLPPGRRDRRRLALRAPRHAARRRGADARDLGVLPRLRRADAAGDAVQRHLLAESEGRPPVLRLRHADRPRGRGHPVEVLRSGDELARAPDLHPGLERGRRGCPTDVARTRAGRSARCCRTSSACTSCTRCWPRRAQRAARSSSNPARCASCSARRAKSCRPACCSATTRTS